MIFFCVNFFSFDWSERLSRCSMHHLLNNCPKVYLSSKFFLNMLNKVKFPMCCDINKLTCSFHSNNEMSSVNQFFLYPLSMLSYHFSKHVKSNILTHQNKTQFPEKSVFSSTRIKVSALPTQFMKINSESIQFITFSICFFYHFSQKIVLQATIPMAIVLYIHRLTVAVLSLLNELYKRYGHLKILPKEQLY